MTDRTQWILFFSFASVALQIAVIYMLLTYKRRDTKIDEHIVRVYKHVTGLPQGDIGTILEHISLVMASLATTRVDSAVAFEEIRVHMSSNQDHTENRQRQGIALLAWIKDRIEKFLR